MKRLIIIGCVNICIASYAQLPTQGVELSKAIPPSPNSASLGKYGDVPVSNYSGVPNISIPLYEIKTGQITLPISLSYHAGGIKVEERASSAGLGWSLNAGGVITRTIRGLADDDPLNSGWLSPDKFVTRVLANTEGAQFNNTVKDGIARGVIDGEPDIYYYNFGSYSGKFVMDQDGNCYTIPLEKIKISFQRSSDMKINRWTFITPDGNTYIFGESGTTNGIENVRTYHCSGTPYTDAITAWYIVKIDDVYNNEITFDYDHHNYNIVNKAVASRYNFYETDNTNLDLAPPGSTDCINTSHYLAAPVLAHIYFSGGSVSIVNGTVRTDLPGTYSTDMISVAGTAGIIKRYELVHSYYSGRLMLDKVLEKGYTDQSTTVPDKEYSFAYNRNVALPSVDSYAQDYWGFANGATGNISLVPASSYIAVTGANIPLDGADRNPNELYAKAGLLTQITYPTGGSTEFEYEINKYYDNTTGNNISCGGVRIKKITDNDNISAAGTKIRVFKYFSDEANTMSSGAIVTVPNYQYLLGEQRIKYLDQDHNNYTVGIVTFLVRSAEGNYPLATTQGSPCGYSKVTVLEGENGENGKTEYYYVNPDSQHDTEQNEFPFPSSCSYEWKRGVLTQEYVYKKNSGNTYTRIKEINNTYNAIDSKLIEGIKVGYNPNPAVYGSQYGIQFGWMKDKTFNTASDFSYLASSETKIFDQGNQGLFSSSVTNYEYDNTCYLPSKITTIDSKGENISTYIKYSTDFDERTPCMYVGHSGPPADSYYWFYNPELNAVHKIVEVEKTITSSLLPNTAERILYNQVNIYKGLNLHHVYSLDMDMPVSPQDYSLAFIGNTCVNANDTLKASLKAEFTFYDSKGNLLEQRKANNIYQSYIWDYNKTYAVAVVVNSSYEDIGYCGFEADGTGNLNFNSAGIINDNSAPAGKKVYDLQTAAITRSLDAQKIYTISLWSKNATPTVNGSPPLRTGEAINNWTYFEFQVANVSSLNIYGSCLVDEVKVYPKNAQMTSYTYDPLIGVTSQSDMNGKITYYEYDQWGRLKLVRNNDRDVVKVFDYRIQSGTDQ